MNQGVCLKEPEMMLINLNARDRAPVTNLDNAQIQPA